MNSDTIKPHTTAMHHWVIYSQDHVIILIVENESVVMYSYFINKCEYKAVISVNISCACFKLIIVL